MQVRLAVCRQASQAVIARAHQLVQLVGPHRVQLWFRGGYKAYAEVGAQSLGGVKVRGGKIEGLE